MAMYTYISFAGSFRLVSIFDESDRPITRTNVRDLEIRNKLTHALHRTLLYLIYNHSIAHINMHKFRLTFALLDTSCCTHVVVNSGEKKEDEHSKSLQQEQPFNGQFSLGVLPVYCAHGFEKFLSTQC